LEGIQNLQLTHISYDCKKERLLISDWNNSIHLVLLPTVNEDKLFIKSFSLVEGKDDGQVDHPLGITTQGSNIYVVDYGNNRIQKFSLL